MEALWTFVLRCAWYLLPMGFANIAPVLVRHHFSALAIPVDRLLGNRGIFGTHKTVRGILAAVVFGIIGFWWQQLVSATPWAAPLGFFHYPDMAVWFGVLAGFGAIIGDLFRSAVKRRVGIRPGGRFVPFDQLDYVVGGILFTLPLFQPTWSIILGTLGVGFCLHVTVSAIGYALGMKRDQL
ncbi:MAG: CDP-archaeol synthase [bacterium]